MTAALFILGLSASALLNLLLLRTLRDPNFRIWPAPEPGSWQSLAFWGLFRGSMTLTLVVTLLDWNSVPIFDWTRLLIGVPLFFGGFAIAVLGYLNLGLGNTYGSKDGLVTEGLYRFSRNPQYLASILGLIGLAIAGNSALAIVLIAMLIAAYVLMAHAEETWLETIYGAAYRDYLNRTARFLDLSGLLTEAERRLRLTR